MFTSHLALTMALALGAPAAPKSDPSTGDVVIEKCEVSSIEDQAVPAGDAGVLMALNVREGMRVTKEMEIARVDDREAQAQKTVKQLDYEVAEQDAKSDINIRFQQATADVAKQAYERLVQANKGSDRAVSQIEVLKAKLEWEKAKLGIEKETETGISNKLTAKAKKAEVDFADVAVARKVLRAPFEGVIIKVFRKPGEWVSPGDGVVQIVRVDRLRVGGNLQASNWGPGDIEGRKVTVEVLLPRGRIERVPGKIVFVSPVVALGSELPVTAEIDSPMENGRPLVRAGLEARMIIHTSQPAEQPTVRPAAARKAPAKG
jgi:multidrug resistance efflux pump